MEIIYPRGSLGTRFPPLGAGVAKLPGIASAGPWLTPPSPPSPQNWGPCPPVLLALSPGVLAVPSPGSGNISVPDEGKRGVREPPGPTLPGPFSASRQHCHCRSRGPLCCRDSPVPTNPPSSQQHPRLLRGAGGSWSDTTGNPVPAGIPGTGARAEPRCASARTSSPSVLAHGDDAPQKHQRPTW